MYASAAMAAIVSQSSAARSVAISRRYHKVTSFPRGMMAPMPAAHLNLWKQHLGHVPETVWDQHELESLVLADNDLVEVSERIGELAKLRMLDLGHNQLTRVPGSLAGLDSLTDFLYLHDNRLSSLP